MKKSKNEKEEKEGKKIINKRERAKLKGKKKAEKE